MSPVRVAVDAMGGDRGPEEIVAGALEAAADTIVPVIYGPASLDTVGLEHVVAEQVIAMDEKRPMRAKPDSSLVAACRSIAEGTADAVVSAGNTGAMLAAGLLVHRDHLLGDDVLQAHRVERGRAVDDRYDRVGGRTSRRPATISSGPRSPPMASTATLTGLIGLRNG